MKTITLAILILCGTTTWADDTAIRKQVVATRRDALAKAEKALDEAKANGPKRGEIKAINKAITLLKRESEFWPGIEDGTHNIPHTWCIVVKEAPKVERIDSSTEFLGSYEEGGITISSPFSGTRTSLPKLKGFWFSGWDTSGFTTGKTVQLSGYGYAVGTKTYTKQTNGVNNTVPHVVHIPDSCITKKPLKAAPAK